ncbi:hypothetical protein EYF80_032763 [Liparis tanakae]|uniref:Uncharacterized protein n=1 Tax=Liparis tanakae TaxID=230148 RepID=A0A4Z2GWA9_9TELE|nr:hypothetical protein EYF80_032763 [Liparis tanakae]
MASAMDSTMPPTMPPSLAASFKVTMMSSTASFISWAASEMASWSICRADSNRVLLWSRMVICCWWSCSFEAKPTDATMRGSKYLASWVTCEKRVIWSDEERRLRKGWITR